MKCLLIVYDKMTNEKNILKYDMEKKFKHCKKVNGKQLEAATEGVL